eukprot:2825305-Pyramimonas_sp.AAC.1
MALEKLWDILKCRIWRWHIWASWEHVWNILSPRENCSLWEHLMNIGSSRRVFSEYLKPAGCIVGVRCASALYLKSPSRIFCAVGKRAASSA